MSENVRHAEFVVAETERKSGSGRRFSRRNLTIIVAAIVVVLGIIVPIAVTMQQRDIVVPLYDPGWPKEYDQMTPTQIRGTLYHNTKLDTDVLATDKINSWTIRSFDKAYEAGRALTALGKYKKAGEAYAVANKYAGKSTSYKFYFDYYNLAIVNKDDDLAKRLSEKAIAAVNADKKLDVATRQELVENMTMREGYRELEKTL